MGGENGGDINLSLLTEGNSDAGQPFMEVSNDSSFGIVANILETWNREG